MRALAGLSKTNHSGSFIVLIIELPEHLLMLLPLSRYSLYFIKLRCPSTLKCQLVSVRLRIHMYPVMIVLSLNTVTRLVIHDCSAIDPQIYFVCSNIKATPRN